MPNQRLSSAIIGIQALVIVGLLYWLLRESQANPFMRAWISQNTPALSLVLNESVLLTAMGAVMAFTGLWFLLADRSKAGPTSPLAEGGYVARPSSVEYELVIRPTVPVLPQEMRPFYETVDLRVFMIIVGLGAQAVSMWLITAGSLRITNFPPDALFYVERLPFTFWWGLGATLGLLWARTLVKGWLRTTVELSTLFLLALYVIGLPSFVYEDPRIQDSYQHTGNSLGLLNYNGWVNAPIWYLKQFPGAFTFFAQLISVAGVDPFGLMKYYVVGLSWVVVFFVYVITRAHSQQYAAPISALAVSGLWFQLHISPQSLALIPYLGIFYLLTRSLADKARRRVWTLLAVVTVPALVTSHPTTPLVLIVGMVVFLASFPLLMFSTFKDRLRQNLPTMGAFFTVLGGCTFVWWWTVASEARKQVENISERAILLGLTHLAREVPIPATPAPTYYIVITLQQAVSLAVWTLGAALCLFFRRFRVREYLFASLFTGAVSTIPIAVFAKSDVLQRSYLFALFPAAILLGWVLERRDVLGVRRRSLFPYFRAVLMLSIVSFSVLVPVTRNGIDPFDYIPKSSLQASETVAGLEDHSILFIHPGDYGWRFYAALRGDVRGPRVEQPSIQGLPGGFVKINSTLEEFNLNFTSADASAEYISISDYYQNLYTLRFGPNSDKYVGGKMLFESQVAQRFDLVYSTGTDRVYANRDLT